ncbi:MAG: hypothetical protein JXP48_00630 [Acidobacteria bacterium]|nr:hypothetical protein [Acidobacteriota bacterium]
MPEKPTGPGARSCWSIFAHPLDTLDSLRHHPRWLLPLLAAAVAAAASNLYVLRRVGLMRLVDAAAAGGALLDAEGLRENVLEHQAQIHAFQAATAFAGPFVTALPTAAVFWLMLVLFGRDIPCNRVLAVVAHVWLLTVGIREGMKVLAVTWIADTGRFDIGNPLATNPAFFFRPSSQAALRALVSLDAITFLGMTLLVAGLVRVCPGLPRTHAALAVVLPWVIYVGGMVIAPAYMR